METTDTQTLLQAYARHDSESAFRELVECYLRLVYSTALRRCGGRAHLAEDIAQTVFTDLARKACALPDDVLLGGWLHQHTCFVAANFLRTETRRAERENQAVQMNTLNESSDETWKKNAPILDDAINELPPEDRDAVTLRYFEQRDFRSIGATLGVSDDAAQKRVSRAINKLRDQMMKHGVTLSAVALGTVLTSQSTAALPPHLAESIIGSALTKKPLTGLSKSLLTLKVGLALLALLTVALMTPKLFNLFAKNSLAETKTNSTHASASNSLQSNAPSRDAGFPAKKNANLFLSSGAGQPSDTNVLTLTIISAASQRPIPNATIESLTQTKTWTRKKMNADAYGVCRIPIVPDLKSLELTSQIDGFADTRLTWNLEHGDTLPVKYILAVDRAVVIGGKVLDPNGNPVESARVGLSLDDDLAGEKFPQSHEFGWIEVRTDKEGRWQINRIADDMIRRLRGGARHTNFLDSPYFSVATQENVEAELRNRTHIFRLGKGLALHGVVVGTDHQPVPGAKVFFAGVGMSHRRETIAGLDGTFSIDGCSPDKDTLTAEADGYANNTIEVEGSVNSGPYEILLQPGKILRMRVLNQQKEPIPHANVFFDVLDRPTPSPAKMPVQVAFYPLTDSDGRVIWTNAPDLELAFDVAAPGYFRARDVKMYPDGEEHIVTLEKSLTVFGTVRNETGEPIPRFRIICGNPRRSLAPGTMRPYWSDIARFWINFSGGNYRYTFEEDLGGEETNPKYLLRFEADGYASFVSRVLEAIEGEVQLNVTLKKGVTTIATVFTPEGMPAARADVGLVSSGDELMMGADALALKNMNNPGALLETDKNGQFRFSPDGTITRILITHPNGFIDTTAPAVVASPTLYLQKWGSIKGTVFRDGKPFAGQYFILGVENNIGNSVSYDFRSSVKTDEAGQFIYPKVFSGTHKMQGYIPGLPSDSEHSSPIQNVTISAGEITEVNFEMTTQSAK